MKRSEFQGKGVWRSMEQQEFQGTGEYVASQELMASVNIAIALKCQKPPPASPA